MCRTMSALTDHLDRITQLASSIRIATSATAHTATGPFTRAVLETPIVELARDIDPSEIGLFTLVSSGPVPNYAATALEDSPNTTRKAEIARVTLPIATPLRKPSTRPLGREGGRSATEHDPEVYANAALKLLDRYQSVRPMPRFVDHAETILGQVATVRESIAGLNDKLQQLSGPASSEALESPEARITAEERRIVEIQAKIAELKKQKDALLSRKRAGSQSGARAVSQSKSRSPEPERALPTLPPDAEEEDFWNTPGAPARTLHFHFTGDLLRDEQLDLTDPLSSPPTMAPAYPRGARQSRAMQFTVRESLAPPELSPAYPRDARQSRAMQFTARESLAPPELSQEPDESQDAGNGSDDAEDDANEEDKTIIFKKSPPSGASTEDSSINQSRQLLEPESVSMVMNPDKSSDHPTKTRFKITTEVERIVSKIWSSMGDTIMPGHSFDVSGAGSNKPPRAKETIKHLQSLATQKPAVDSPSVSSLSSLSTAQGDASQPTAQQIATAHILLALLSAPPSHSMSLNALKDVLSSSNEGMVGAAVTRPIYACVAKRLLKIERGGGKQVVKFDVEI
ncbi:hypothetical protein BC835DRAFT_323423 [Cytidiella melzeri]|nr:hypothetical protein BC835DRAFT_323423 [Cytidiella melzeri]